MAIAANVENEVLDKEWIDLIDCARQLGIGQDEIRRFLRELQGAGSMTPPAGEYAG